MTNPSRPLSNGLDAVFGSSLRVERAFMEVKPPTPGIAIAASEPPLTTTLARPSLMMSRAEHIAVVEEAQADTVPKLGPPSPYLMEM